MRSLRSLLASTRFNLAIGFLVLLSVLMLGLEIALQPEGATLESMILAQDLILLLLILELGLRWKVSRSTSVFLKTHWLEILAILPMLRIFRLGRIALLLRFVQLFSFGAIFQRRLKKLQSLLSSRWPEYMVLGGLTLFALVFGTLGLAEFETSHSIATTQEAFWQALFSLLAGEYADYPVSLGGRMVYLILVLFGMGIFAMLTGTISAFMMDKLKEDDMILIQDGQDLQEHIILCGWTSQTEVLMEELSTDPQNQNCDILLISMKAGPKEIKNMGLSTDRVMVMSEDFTQAEVLKRAGILTAKTAMILAEERASRTSQDTDARTILAALTIEKLNPGIHTIAELNHGEYLDHLKMGGVDDVILKGDVGGRLMSRAGLSKGLLPFFDDLLTHKVGNTLCFRSLPRGYEGRILSEALSDLHAVTGGTVVGVRAPQTQNLEVNPTRRRLTAGDELLIILPSEKITHGR